MIDTQSIRVKILDLAMRGQLTEQLPEDAAVDTLYREIQAEKQALIKAGIIKKEKPLAVISEEDYPFVIPSRWKWVYLGELFQHNTGKALNSNDTQGQELEYITTSNLYWERFVLDDLKTMHFAESEIEKCTVKKGDLLVCEGGDIGRSAIWPYDFDMRIQNHIHRLRKYCAGICTEFYYYLLWLYKQTGRINGIGIGLQGFSAKRVHSLIVPLVPTEEAERVVKIIKQSFSVLDTIDELQMRYADNLAMLKNKLIDAAIQGKLTEQLPEDGTAEELYQQIQKEKQTLIEAGKIKKEKPLPEITDVEVPFEIPSNWKWIRVGEVGSWSAGATPSRNNNNYYSDGTIPWLKTGELNDGYISESEEHITEEALRDCSIRLNPVGSVLIAMYGATIGKTGILEIEATTNQACCACIPIGIDNKFLFYFLKSNKNRFLDASHGGAQPNISKKIIVKSMFPLPPLAEQRRIVEIIDALIKTIDS